MPLPVSCVVEVGVGVHCRGHFMIVHWIGVVAEPHLAEFLRQSAFLQVDDLTGFLFPFPVFYSSPFNPAVIAAILFGEPAEELSSTH